MIHIDDTSLAPRIWGRVDSLSVAYLFFSMITLLLFKDYLFFPPGVITLFSSLTTLEDKLITPLPGLCSIRTGFGTKPAIIERRLCTQRKSSLGKPACG